MAEDGKGKTNPFSSYNKEPTPMNSDRPIIVVIWKMKKMDGDAAWHIAEFRSHLAASARTQRLRSRTDVEHVKMVDIQ